MNYYRSTFSHLKKKRADERVNANEKQAVGEEREAMGPAPVKYRSEKEP